MSTDKKPKRSTKKTIGMEFTARPKGPGKSILHNFLNSSERKGKALPKCNAAPVCDDITAVIRELMLAIEYLRSACEHTEAKTNHGKARLSLAMGVGIRVNARHAGRISDYQRASFWADVIRLADAEIEKRFEKEPKNLG